MRKRPFTSMYGIVLILVSTSFYTPARATVSFSLEHPSDSLVGTVDRVSAKHEDTLPDIARANGLGFMEIKLANPGVDTWLPGEGTEIVLPNLYVLPGTPHEGIVLNIPEMRLYYFPAQDEGPGVRGDNPSCRGRPPGLGNALYEYPDHPEKNPAFLVSSRINPQGTCRAGRPVTETGTPRTEKPPGQLYDEAGNARVYYPRHQ